MKVLLCVFLRDLTQQMFCVDDLDGNLPNIQMNSKAQMNTDLSEEENSDKFPLEDFTSRNNENQSN